MEAICSAFLVRRHGGAAAFLPDRQLQSQIPCCWVQIPDSSVCTEVIEYSRDAPFSPNAVVTIRTLGQEKRQFLISDMMRMSVAQHRQTYKVGRVRLGDRWLPSLTLAINADWPVKVVRWAM